MQIEDVLTSAQLKRLRRNLAIRKDYDKLRDKGLTVAEVLSLLSKKFKLSEVMLRNVIKKRTAL